MGGDEEALRTRIETLRGRAANATADELKKLAVDCGWTYRGVGGGGHHKLSMPSRFPLLIPNHKKLNKNTVRGVLKVIEQSLDETAGSEW